jgi:hypothetical protein
MHRMMELTVNLGFACCHCEGRITATLVCTGKGLQPRDGSTPVAAVEVLCPNCKRTLRVIFEPVDGTIHDVKRVALPASALMPSMN